MVNYFTQKGIDAYHKMNIKLPIRDPRMMVPLGEKLVGESCKLPKYNFALCYA